MKLQVCCCAVILCLLFSGGLSVDNFTDYNAPMIYTSLNNVLTGQDRVVRYYADVDAIFASNATGLPHNAALTLKLPNQFWGLAASYESGTVFINSHTDEKLFSYSVETDEVHIVMNDMTRGLRHMSYDWVTRSLYWSDRDLNAIFVTDKSFEYTRAVYTSSGRPSGVDVDLIRRKLVFSDTSHIGLASSIYVSNLDGSGRKELVSVAAVVHSVMVHYEQKRIYWTEHDGFFSSVKSCDYNGGTIKTLRSSFFSFFYDITYFGEWIMVTDTEKDSAGEYVTFLMNEKTQRLRSYTFNFQFAHNLAFYGPRPEFQNITFTNECNENDCEQMCLASDNGEYSCKCSYGYIQQANTCTTTVIKDDFLVFTDIGQERAFQMSIMKSSGQVTDYNVVPFEHDVKIYALTVDASSGEVVWYDLLKQNIVWGDYRQSFSFKIAVIKIVVDPISKEVIWSTINENIYISDQDGSNLNMLLSHGISTDVLRVAGIALDLKNRKIYWTEIRSGQDSGKVMRMDYDGSQQEKVLDKMDSPNALTIDYKNMDLYVGELFSNEIYKLSLDKITPTIPSTSRFSSEYKILDMSPYVDPKNFELYDMEAVNGYLYLLDSIDSSLTRFNITQGPSSLENYGPEEFFFMSTMGSFSSSYYRQYIQPLEQTRAGMKPLPQIIKKPTKLGIENIAKLIGIGQIG